jgi:hypothetical protein
MLSELDNWEDFDRSLLSTYVFGYVSQLSSPCSAVGLSGSLKAHDALICIAATIFDTVGGVVPYGD